MSEYLLVAAMVIIACVLCNTISNKIGTPMLLAFMLLGMVFGTDGIFKIPFDDYALAQQICSVALIFIMFYGGFGTRWSVARRAAPQAILLSSVGTVLTAGLVGLFCHFGLGMEWAPSLLVGAVICSTDAASVFSILRSKRLNLRDNTASLLEVESGSNDPFSYMLTILVLSSMNGEASGWRFVTLLAEQVFFGLLFGFVMAGLTLLFLKKIRLNSSGFHSIFLVGVAVVTYALPDLLGGNGYLSAYITGIILGNCRLEGKRELVHFFDGMTGLMQMLLFFLLGLLALPSQLPGVALPALAIALFLTFVARPAAVALLLAPFRCSLRKQALVAWSGMRGAASIVFAMMAVVHPAATHFDIFHMVFFIVLFSILIQGSLLPLVARKLDMTDPDADVMKTFSDYTEEGSVQFIRFTLPPTHPWVGMEVNALTLPPDCLLVLLMRGAEKIIPTGNTDLRTGDTLVLGGLAFQHHEMGLGEGGQLFEKVLEPGEDWVGKTIAQVPGESELIVLIKRGDEVVIPRGDTLLLEEDVLVLASRTE